MTYDHMQSQRFVRLVLVLSAVSPLFILWGVQGSRYFPSPWFEIMSGALFVLPNLGLGLIVRSAIRAADRQPLVVARSTDRKEDVLTYLFALVFPFYAADLNSGRSVATTLIAFACVVYLFWYLRLHYINIIIALRGYRAFAISFEGGQDIRSSMREFVLISKRPWISEGTTVYAYRITHGIYFEGD